MPLVQADLFSAIRGLVTGLTKGAVDFSAVSQAWAAAYAGYAASALTVAPSSLPFAGISQLISSELKGNSDSFADELAAGVSNFWQAAVWTPGAFTGITSVAEASPLAASLRAVFLANTSEKLDVASSSDAIASALHIYTTTLVVVATTNTSSGATATALLV